MEIKQIKDVMKRYGVAWEKQDSGLILECFTKNGIYQESPLSKPHRGHNEIRNFCDGVVKGDTKNIKFKLGKCYVSRGGKIGFAEWECKNDHKWKRDGKWRKDHMVGIMVLKMKGDKILYLNEYWNTKSL